MSNEPHTIAIRLEREKALALFEWAHRFMESGNPQFTHPADAIAVDTLASELESALPEVFTDEYSERLDASRSSVVLAYEAAMEPQYRRWLAKLEYQDAD